MKYDTLKRDLGKVWDSTGCNIALRNSKSPATETKEETHARESFEKSRKIDKEGFIEVGLLWKNKHRPKNNGRMALGIYLGMERRMKTHRGLWEAFDNNVKEWLEKGYARTVPFQDNHRGFFIPTFMVVREDKATTKIPFDRQWQV